MVIVIYVLICVFAVVALRVMKQEMRPLKTQAPIHRCNLFWISGKDFFVACAIYTLAFAAVFGSVFVGERISLITAVVCMLVVGIIFAAANFPSIDMLIKLLRNINRLKRDMHLLKEKCLSIADEGYLYVDEDWFISVGGKTACVLYAAQIDFSRQICIGKTVWSVIHGYAYVDYIILYSQAGDMIKMRIIPNERLKAWIEEHGGVLQVVNHI